MKQDLNACQAPQEGFASGCRLGKIPLLEFSFDDLLVKPEELVVVRSEELLERIRLFARRRRPGRLKRLQS
jgi:hypothetical protein